MAEADKPLMVPFADLCPYQKIVDAVNLLKIISIGQNEIRNGRFVEDEDLDRKILDGKLT